MRIKRWKPKFAERYYAIGNAIFFGFYPENKCRLMVDYVEFCNDVEDKYNHRIGNCFRTKKEAQAKLREVKKLLLN